VQSISQLSGSRNRVHAPTVFRLDIPLTAELQFPWRAASQVPPTSYPRSFPEFIPGGLYMTPALLKLVPMVSAIFVFTVSSSQASSFADNLAKMESQSPIDIRSENTYYGRLPALNFNLASDTSLEVINNGSPDHEATIRANVNPGQGTLTLSGHEWDLAQFHFHTPSEHLINGRSLPMEMHLVFTDSASNLLVVGRGIGIKEWGYNRALDPIFSNLPQNNEETRNIDHFDLNALLPHNLNSFRYSGSLTTSPYTEGVSWIELATPLLISRSQVEAFESLFPHGNSREVQ
jgi:carbonic anhydrase